MAKRARQIVDGAEPLTEDAEKNPVSQATYEVETDAITYIRRGE